MRARKRAQQTPPPAVALPREKNSSSTRNICATTRTEAATAVDTKHICEIGNGRHHPLVKINASESISPVQGDSTGLSAPTNRIGRSVESTNIANRPLRIRPAIAPSSKIHPKGVSNLLAFRENREKRYREDFRRTIQIFDAYSPMYSRLLTRVCERSSYRALTDIRTTQVSRLSHVAVKNEEPTAEIVSAKFPDFKVIYTLPRIQLASAVNKMKRHFTILASLTVPAVYALHNAEILSTNTSIATVATGVILTVCLHSLGIVCNNLIGHIYFHPNNGIVILSYVDYWGRRVDHKISQVNILPVSDNQFSVTDYLFEKVTFSSQKLKLKIFARQGQIFDIQAFRCILGMII